MSYTEQESLAAIGPAQGDATKSTKALTKGELSLVLSGTGRGVDLGFSFGKFTIVAAK